MALKWLSAPALAALVLVLSASGCEPSAGGEDAGTESPFDTRTSSATIKLLSPAPNAGVELGEDAERSVAVEFEVGAFTLKEPGACGEAKDCGHVRIFLDGTRCNAERQSWNNVAIKSPASALVALCPVTLGDHSLTAQLHHDDGAPVKNADGKIASATVTFKAETPANVPEPMIQITSPADGATVTLGTDTFKSVPIEFISENVTLRTGPCGTTPSCGLVILRVDGTACDLPGAPAPLNNFGATSPLNARFNLCQMQTGTHEIELYVLQEDFTIMKNSKGQEVRSKITITTQTAAPPPLQITSPQNGATVVMGKDADLSVPVAFTAQGITLSNPGACGATADCGVLTVSIDGSACNDPGAPVPINNFGTTSPIAAKFRHCPTPSGAHTITLSVLKDDGSPLMVNGAAVTASVSVTTSKPPPLVITSPGENATVSLGTDTDKSVPIVFETSSALTLMGPGQCGATPNCGVLAVNIDGPACNDPGAPVPVNNFGSASPIDAKFGHCATPAGQHTVLLRVMQDNGSPLRLDGTSVEAQVTVTAQ